MKIRSVIPNNRTKAFTVRTYKRAYEMPYAKLDLKPTRANPLANVYVDDELGEEAFTYTLESEEEDTIHIDRVLECTQDPTYMRDLILYHLTLEAKKAVEETDISKRELSRLLGTSPAQLYRLLDQENYRKSIDKLVELLSALDRRVNLTVETKAA